VASYLGVAVLSVLDWPGQAAFAMINRARGETMMETLILTALAVVCFATWIFGQGPSLPKKDAQPPRLSEMNYPSRTIKMRSEIHRRSEPLIDALVVLIILVILLILLWALAAVVITL